MATSNAKSGNSFNYRNQRKVRLKMTMDDIWGVAIVFVIAAVIVGQLKDK